MNRSHDHRYYTITYRRAGEVKEETWLTGGWWPDLHQARQLLEEGDAVISIAAATSAQVDALWEKIHHFASRGKLAPQVERAKREGRQR